MFSRQSSFPQYFLYIVKRASIKRIRSKIKEKLFSFYSPSVCILIEKIKPIRLISRDDLLEASNKYKIITIETQETVKLIRLKELLSEINLYSSQSNISQEYYQTFSSEQGFLYEIKNAKIWGTNGFISDRDFNIVLENLYQKLSHPKRYSSIREICDYLPVFSLLKIILFGTSKRYSGTFYSLLHIYSGNYFHWLEDCLAKIKAIELYEQKTGIKTIPIIPGKLYSWQAESLKLMGIDLESCIKWDGKSAALERIITPCFRHYANKSLKSKRYYNFPSAQTYHWIRHRILSNISSIKENNFCFSKKVFISRNLAKNRRIINEEQILQALHPLGFVKYELEKMNFIEQALMFSHAKIIIAPHGAALTNIIYSQDNITLIELFGSFIDSHYADISQVLGFDYRCLVCKNISSVFLPLKQRDIFVEIDQLKQLCTANI